MCVFYLQDCHLPAEPEHCEHRVRIERHEKDHTRGRKCIGGSKRDVLGVDSKQRARTFYLWLELMKYDGDMPRILFKIGIRGEYRQVEALGCRTDEQVHTTTRHTTGPTQVEELCSLLIVGREHGVVFEVGEFFANALEVPLQPNSGKDFLTDRANETDSPVADQLTPFFDQLSLARVQVSRTSSQGQRPDRRINEYAQDLLPRRRRSLWS